MDECSIPGKDIIDASHTHSNCPAKTIPYTIYSTYCWVIGKGPFGKCYCENFCSWDRCLLRNPPEDCIFGTNSTWVWNSRTKFWVAQTKDSNFRVTHINLEKLGL